MKRQGRPDQSYDDYFRSGKQDEAAIREEMDQKRDLILKYRREGRFQQIDDVRMQIHDCQRRLQ